MLPPTLLLHNARIHTLDPARPEATAVAIVADQIVAIGSDETVGALAPPSTQRIDCGGLTLVPGLHDAHIHLLAYARNLSAVDCSPRNAGSIAELQTTLRRAADGMPPGAWLRAAGYDETALKERRHPTRWDLDTAVIDRPVRLYHRSRHACVVNSAALRRAGITIATESPPGGLMERDVITGEPNGVLFETAQDLVRRVMPSPTQGELSAEVAAASLQLLKWGVTALQDATASNAPADWSLFQRLQRSAALQQRVTLMMGLSGFDDVAGWDQQGEAAAGMLRRGAVKLVLDESGGTLHPPQDELDRMAAAVHRSGGQLALHVVTPTALEAAIAALTRAQTDFPRFDPRHRIEHCAVCNPEQAARLAKLGVHVCTQPGFVHESGDRYLAEVPGDQLPWLYPLATLLNASVPLSAGSDAPVAEPNPLVGLHAAMTRRSASGRPVTPGQRLTPLQALSLYTSGAAAACFQEKRLGRVAPGYAADLALLSADPVSDEPGPLLGAHSALTVVAGAVRWSEL
ncbi:MAG: amidohydrolase [Dehalococcoidia bacterium]|nr:amidohydrolase [Dehalococcoidia bacterium]